MVESVSKGDKIVTSGGITGTVTKSVAEQDTVEVEIAKDVRVNVMRSMIADVPQQKNAPKPAANHEKKPGGLFGFGKK